MSITARPRSPEPVDQDANDVVENSTGVFWQRSIPSWLVSGIGHFLLLIVLALVTVAAPHASANLQIAATPVRPDEKVIEIEQELPELNLDPNSAIEPLTHIVAVEQIRVAAGFVQTPVEQVGQRGFAGPGEAGEPDA